MCNSICDILQMSQNSTLVMSTVLSVVFFVLPIKAIIRIEKVLITF